MANLLSDKPITSESEDVLGLTAFADALAKSLGEMAPEEGLVVSVEGEWGSGKTSAIQLTQRRLIIRELARELGIPLAELERREWSSIEADWDALVEKRRTYIVRFNPWNFSGQDNLVRAFFSEVGATIGHPPDGPVSKAIKKITGHLSNAGTLIGGIAGAIASGGPAVGAGATVGRAVGEAAQRLLGASGSLESAKGELAVALKQAGKRIIVIIDDLDRLLPSEMRAMFSLVKSLGDLPGVFYVLSYDHIAVSRALRAGSEPIEPEFLEKIVQVPLKLPPPWQPEIRQLFFAKLNAVILDAVPNDESRWRKVFFEAIEPYIRNPRDVTRLANTLQVIWPNVAGDVDLTDLLILTTLQLFEPAVYQLVFENIEVLAGESVSFEDKKIFAARLEPKAANKLDVAKKALAHLFPKLAEGWAIHIWDGTVYLKKREQRRVCTREYYRNYFLFGRDPDRVSRGDIESALESDKPFERLNALIDRIKDMHSRRGMSRVGALLDQIFEIVFSKPLLTELVLQAILDLSDTLIEREDIVWEFFVTDNYSRLDAILTFGLEPLALIERGQRVQFMASHRNGLNISALTIEHLAAQHGLYGHQAKHETERLITLDDAEKAATKIVARIRKAASTGKILTMSDPSRLIWAWSRLTTPGRSQSMAK